MKWLFVFMILLFTGILFMGCAVHFGGKEKLSYTLKTDVPKFFDTPRDMPKITFKPINNYRPAIEAYKFSFPSWYKSGQSRNDSLQGVLYVPNKIKSRDIFIVLPGTGEEVSAKVVARMIAKMGFRTVRIKSGFRPIFNSVIRKASSEESAEAAVDLAGGFVAKAMRQRTIDLMRLIDYLQASFDISAFHAIGISVGGSVANLLTAVDPRVESLMMLISSANLARIMMDSKMDDLTRLRNILEKKFGLSYKEIYSLIQKKIAAVEPITYTNRLDPKRMLMVSGYLDIKGIVDSAIPYSATLATWEAYHKPEWVYLIPTGHITSFFCIFSFLDRMAEIPPFFFHSRHV